MAAGAVVIGMSQQVNGVQIYGTCLFAGLVRSFRRVNGGVSIVLARSRFRPAGARSFSPKMGHVEPLDIQSNRTSVPGICAVGGGVRLKLGVLRGIRAALFQAGSSAVAVTSGVVPARGTAIWGRGASFTIS